MYEGEGYEGDEGNDIEGRCMKVNGTEGDEG